MRLNGSRKVTWTPKRRANHKAACQKRSASPIWQAAHTAACRKLATDPAWLANNAVARQKMYTDSLWRAKNVAANRKKAVDSAWRKKNTAARLKLYADPVWRAKKAAATRAQFINPVWRINHVAGCRKRSANPAYRTKNALVLCKARKKARRAHPSSIERMIWLVLDRLGIFYAIEHRIGPYLADIFIPGKKLVIECDGSYWHSRPETAAKDACRDVYMKARGYRVLRLPEWAIRDGWADDRVLQAVK